MTRALAFASIVLATFLAGFAFMTIEFQFLFHSLGPALIRASAIRAGIWILALPLCFFVARQIAKGRSWFFNAASLTSICFAGALLTELTYLSWVAGHGGLRLPRERRERQPGAIITFALTSVHAPFVLLLSSTTILTLISAREDERDRELRVSRLEARLSEARLNLLRSQLHPHFLFNALNSVLALIRSDASRAKEMLAKLSKFYAITSFTEGRHVIALSEELRFVREYVDIEQVRFGDRLSISIDAAEHALEAGVPALLLQPLVENAIKHGVARTPGPGRVLVHATASSTELQLTVEDNGPWLEANERGVGLANTRARLLQLYGSRYRFEIEPTSGGGSRVQITIPLEMHVEESVA